MIHGVFSSWLGVGLGLGELFCVAKWGKAGVRAPERGMLAIVGVNARLLLSSCLWLLLGGLLGRGVVLLLLLAWGVLAWVFLLLV